jgi:MFS family permease
VARGRLVDRSRAFLSTGSTLAAFRIPGYPALWVSGAAAAVGWSVSFVAVGWITLQVSDSPLAVAATFAVRLLPALLLGIPLGALVDRYDRRMTLITVNVLSLIAMLAVAGIAFADQLGLPEILATSLVLGTFDTLRGTANQSYAVDLAGPQGATNAIALGNLGGALLGSVGAIIGGIVLEEYGPGATFVVAALPSSVAAALLLLSRRRGHGERAVPRLTPSFRSSITLILRNRLVATIAFVVVVGEALGFSTMSLYPTFARDVLHVDAAGLGLMSGARSIGGVIGLLTLATLGFRGRGGRLLVLTLIIFGLSLVGFALSTVFAISLLLLVVIGGASSSLDTLGQSLIQQSVEDNERGAAMGIWFFSIGFGPFGFLALGGAATVFGGPVAMLVSGALLATIGLGLTTVKRLRELR